MAAVVVVTHVVAFGIGKRVRGLRLAYRVDRYHFFFALQINYQHLQPDATAKCRLKANELEAKASWKYDFEKKKLTKAEFYDTISHYKIQCKKSCLCLRMENS